MKIFQAFLIFTAAFASYAFVGKSTVQSDDFFESFPIVSLDSVDLENFLLEEFPLMDSVEFSQKLNSFKPFQRAYNRYTPVRKYGAIDLNPKMQSLLVIESDEYWGFRLYLLNYDLEGNPQNYSLLASVGGDAGYYESSAIDFKDGKLIVDYDSELPFNDGRGEIHLIKKTTYIFNEDLTLKQIEAFSKADTTY